MDKHLFHLPENHGWTARPGYKIFVADRGACRFDFPEDWHVSVGSSIKITDRPPPDDDCVLEISVVPLPILDPERIPMETLLRETLQGESNLQSLQEKRCAGHRLISAERRGLDPPTGRAARWHYALALCPKLYAFLTFCFWEDDAGRYLEVWHNVLDSLELGKSYPSPFSGRPTDPLAQ